MTKIHTNGKMVTQIHLLRIVTWEKKKKKNTDQKKKTQCELFHDTLSIMGPHGISKDQIFVLSYHGHGPAIRRLFFFFSFHNHIHIKRNNCSKGIIQSMKGIALFHAELITSSKQKILLCLIHRSWDLRILEQVESGSLAHIFPLTLT